MLALTREPAVASVKSTIKSTEAKKHEKVSPNKFWKVTYQLGPNRGRANVFPSNAWKKRSDQLPGEEPLFDPVYRVFEQIVDSEGANSLIQKSNDWQAANTRHKIEGEIGKMLVVLDVHEEKDYVPQSVAFLHGGMPMQVLKMIVDAAVESRLKTSKS